MAAGTIHRQRPDVHVTTAIAPLCKAMGHVSVTQRDAFVTCRECLDIRKAEGVKLVPKRPRYVPPAPTLALTELPKHVRERRAPKIPKARANALAAAAEAPRSEPLPAPKLTLVPPPAPEPAPEQPAVARPEPTWYVEPSEEHASWAHAVMPRFESAAICGQTLTPRARPSRGERPLCPACQHRLARSG